MGQHQRSQFVADVRVDDDIVMMDIDRGEYYGLSGVSATLWELLVEPKSLEELAARVCDEYDVDRETCLADLSNFLDQLYARGLVKLS